MLKSSRVIIGEDINMRHPLWGPVINDHRSADEGLPFVDFLTSTGLNIWNKPDSPPTFETVNGRSWIDITVASDVFDYAAPSWQVITSTLSDHNYITFDQGPACTVERAPMFRLNKFRLVKMASNLGLFTASSPRPTGGIAKARKSWIGCVGLTVTIQNVSTTYLKHVTTRPKTVPWCMTWDIFLGVGGRQKANNCHVTKTYHRAKVEVEKPTCLHVSLTYHPTLRITEDNSYLEMVPQTQAIPMSNNT
ncbi:hypothetical protein HNY73_007765 [Argiope bruennichi]|uniref:Endonuclease/exonuclease/phosphatase domain-containing protein n=1 Tax=Argiope bruennichi TaxID=94029 RepID=A0A8T0FFP1_ARGBR|nr:hypothetical protein HNY73_007765 [Argiope bruennichi]